MSKLEIFLLGIVIIQFIIISLIVYFWVKISEEEDYY